MDLKKYENEMVYPRNEHPRNKCPKCNTTFSTNAKFCEECALPVAEWYTKELEKYEALVDKYSQESARLNGLFREDALEHVGLTGHEAADRAFSYAYEHGHSAGNSEILSCLYDIAYVVLGFAPLSGAANGQ